MNPHTATIALALSLTGTALAGNTNDWIVAEGDWTNPANWSNGSVPTMSEIGIIANGGHAHIMHQDIELSSMILGTTIGGRLGFGGFSQYGGSTTIGGQSTITIGRNEGVNGHLTLYDGAQMTATNGLTVGHEGHGIANITDGSIVEFGELRVAGFRSIPNRTFTGSGFLEVAGEGSLIRTTDENAPEGMTIGAGGSAIVHVRDGGRIETANGLLLSSTTQGSNLIIEGPSSAVQVSGTYFDTGRDITLPDDHPPVGDAVLTLRNGGTLDASNTSRAMTLFSQTRIEGTGTLMGDAYFYQGSTIDPGEHNEYGHLSFTHQLDSVLEFNSSITGGTFHFDIGSTDNFDRLSVHDLIAGGTLEVAIADDFIAEYGQTFDIINADTLTGDFDLIVLPELEGSLFFEADIHAQGVTLHVVPAPASMIVLALTTLIRPRRNRAI
ncbi:MAG: hypothetical protein CMJ35_00795 [Phycisphaerae bacterium]|nr:hypothetical protein [Phycisphaerae bacterium]MBM90138.1 hypothetical protein [Phycisphaerae bacterium]HCT46197.1 hypothetical protein [Phycisphaerales bacterium]